MFDCFYWVVNYGFIPETFDVDGRYNRENWRCFEGLIVPAQKSC